MSSLPIPELEHLGSRPFSFYPAILNIDRNEWLFRRATWSEVLVVNCQSAEEIWIPRRFLGEVSRVDDPVLIFGLSRELEYREGSVWPCRRTVIQMPVAVGEDGYAARPRAERQHPAPVVGIRVAPTTDHRVFRLIAAALVAGILLYVAAVSVTRIAEVAASLLRGTERF